MSTWSLASTTGVTSTAANEVCRRAWLSNGLIRTSRWTPCSPGERAVGERPLDREGGRLDAGLLRVLGVEDVEPEVVALGPAGVHAQQHLGPVLRVDPARTRVDLHQGVALVVVAGQQRADLELLDRAAERGQRGLDLGQQVLVLELDGRTRVVDAGAEVGQLLERRTHDRLARRDLLRPLLVAPEIGVAGLLVERGQLGAQRRGVQHDLDAAEGGVQLAQALTDVGHVRQRIDRPAPGTPPTMIDRGAVR